MTRGEMDEKKKTQLKWKPKKKEQKQPDPPKPLQDPKSFVEIHGPLEQQFAEGKCVIYERPDNPAVADIVFTNCKPALLATIRSAVSVLPECVRFHPEHVEFCAETPRYVAADTIIQFLSRVQLRMDPELLDRIDPQVPTPLSELNDSNSVLFELKVKVPADRPPIGPPGGAPLPPNRQELLQKDFLSEIKKLDQVAASIFGEKNWMPGFRDEPYFIVPDVTPLPEVEQQLHTVWLRDVKWVPIGRQLLWPKRHAPVILDKNVPLLRLKPGEEFHLQIRATRDSASPKMTLAVTEQAEVAQATYHDLFDVQAPQFVAKDVALALEQACAAKTGNAFPQSVFDIECSGTPDLLDPKCKVKLKVVRPWACTGCRRCWQVAGIAPHQPVADAGVMTLVTTGKYRGGAVAQQTIQALLAQHRKKQHLPRPHVKIEMEAA